MNITQWLERNGFGEYTEFFNKNEITIEDLPKIANHNDLKEIGITNFIKRNKIIAAITGKPAHAPTEMEQSDMASSDSVLDEQEQLIIKEYPYLIAYPFHEMLNEKHPFIKLNLLKDIVLNVLKYMGLIVATEYFRSSSQSRELNDLFRDKIYLPSFGSWNHFLRVAIEYLQSEDHSFLIPELIDFYQKVETGKKRKLYSIRIQYTDKYDNLGYKKTEGTLIGLLINFRNKHLGHSTTLKDEEAQKIFNEYYPFLKTLLAEMIFCTNYQMIKYEDGHLFSLMGDTIHKIESNTKNVAEDERVWIQNPAGDKMPLIPFFIIPKEYFTEISNDTELFIYDQFTSKRIVFFSPERGEGLSEGKIVQKLQLIISNKRKQTPFTLQSLTEEKLKDQLSYINKNISEGLINERKVLPGIYQERSDAEISLKSWVKGQASVFFLASEAGGGKTNLLNEMNRQYLESGFDSLLLRANRFNFDYFHKQLKHELNLANDFAFKKHTCFQRQQDNPFLILIDGLNEYKNPLEFLSSIKEFQAKLKGGGVKIVISWRVNTIKDLPELDDSWESFLYNAGDDEQEIENILAKKAFWLKRMNKMELEGAWEHYTSQKQFKTKFTLQELTYKDRLLSNQLSNPLLLRMFLELFRGKALTNLPTGALNLWELWYKDISKTEGTDEIFLSLTALMLEKEKSVLLLDTLYDHPVLSTFVLDIQINNPFQQLLKKGTLSQYFINNEIVVSFTMEALLHYCLGMGIRNTEKYNDDEELLKLTQTNRLPGIKETLKYILWNDILQNEYASLNYFISKGEEYDKITPFPLAQAFMLYDIDDVLKNILQEYSENEWRTILFAIDELGSAQEELVIKDLLKKIQKYINVKSVVECYIILESLPYLEPEIRLELLNKIIAYTTTIDKLDQSDRIILLNKLANVYNGKGDYDKALDCTFKSLEIKEKILGKDHPETAGTYNNIGFGYSNQGDYDRALEYHFKSLEVREKVLGKDHPEAAASYSNIGNVYNDKGEYEKALEYHFKSLEIYEKVLGKEDLTTSSSYLFIGIVYHDKGDYDKALEYYFKSLTIREKILGNENSSTASTYNNIGNVYKDQGEYDKALEHYFKALAIKEKVLGKEHLNTADSYNNIGTVYSDKGDYEKTLEYYFKALAILEKVLGKEHLRIAGLYSNIGLVYSYQRDYEKALEYQLKSLEIREKILGKEHPETAASYINIGIVYDYKGDHDKALDYFFKSLLIKEKVLGKEHPDTATSYDSIGTFYGNKGYDEKALEYHLKTLEIREKVLGNEHPDTADSYRNIGADYFNLRNFEKALEYLLKSLAIRDKVLGNEHPLVKETIALIEDIRSLQKEDGSAKSEPVTQEHQQVVGKTRTKDFKNQVRKSISLGKKDLVTTILAILALILTVFIVVTRTDERDFNTKPFNTQLIKKAELYSDPHLNSNTEEWASVPVGTALVGTKIKVMESDNSNLLKVMLPDSTMGWVNRENIKQSKIVLVKGITGGTCVLWNMPNYKKGKPIRSINEREMLTIVGQPEKINNTLVFYKVKDKNDTVGWINSSYLTRVGWEVPRFVNRETWRLKKDSFEENWKGKPISEFIKKFAEPAAIKDESGKKIYFFNNIYLYHIGRKYIGQQVITQHGIIEEIKQSGKATEWIGYFPASSVLRSNFLMNTIWDLFNFSDYERLDKYGDPKAKKIDSLWAGIILGVLYGILMLSLFYIILNIPYFVSSKIAIRFSLNPKLKNSIIKYIVLTVTIVLGYIWFVFISVNIGTFNNWFLVFLLFSLFLARRSIRKVVIQFAN